MKKTMMRLDVDVLEKWVTRITIVGVVLDLVLLVSVILWTGAVCHCENNGGKMDAATSRRFGKMVLQFGSGLLWVALFVQFRKRDLAQLKKEESA